MRNLVQMLRQEKSVATMLADPSSEVCAAKEKIVTTLNGVATQLLTNIADLNATDAATLKAKTDAYQVRARVRCTKRASSETRIV